MKLPPVRRGARSKPEALCRPSCHGQTQQECRTSRGRAHDKQGAAAGLARRHTCLLSPCQGLVGGSRGQARWSGPSPPEGWSPPARNPPTFSSLSALVSVAVWVTAVPVKVPSTVIPAGKPATPLAASTTMASCQTLPSALTFRLKSSLPAMPISARPDQLVWNSRLAVSDALALLTFT